MAEKLPLQELLDKVGDAAKGADPRGIFNELKQQQTALMERFNGLIDGAIKPIKEPIAATVKIAKDAEKALTSVSFQSFAKDPIKEGTKLVTNGIKSLDSFFAKLFKLLAKDIGSSFSNFIGKWWNKSFGQIDKLLKGLFKLAAKETAGLFKFLQQFEGKFAKALSKEILKINGIISKIITNWGKSSGLTKAIGQVATIGASMAKSSTALTALKDLPKAMGSLLGFVKLIGKAAPLISSFVDLFWKNEVTNKLKSLEREARLQDAAITRNHAAVFTKLKQIETQLKPATIDYTKISTAVKTSIPSDLARKSDVTTIGTAIGRINYTQQLNTIAQGVSALKNLGQTQTIDYSRIQNAVTTAVNAAKTPTKEPTAIDYQKVTAAATAALTAANLSPNSISDSVVSKTKQPTAIDYQKVTAAAAAALTSANLSPSSISDSVTAKTKSVTPAELAQILEKNNTTQSLAQAAAIKQGLASVKVDIPADVARKSDVAAIPSKIPKATLDLAPVLSRLSTIDNTLVNLGQRFKPVDLNPVQDKLNQIQNQVSQIPSQVTNNLNTVSNSIVNSLSNFITNNNTTIINKMEPALNADAIINPLKTHINTQVAQPLATTMEVLNVNDLKRGVTMSGEAVIKASGFQQYGQSDTGTATATNLIGLTAMMAAPLFMRAGFHQLGTEFPADMRNPTGEKVKPTTALSTSHWQFNQISNLVGIPATQMVTGKTGVVTALSFKNQSDAIENIHAQNLGMEQDISAIEKYCFKMTQQNEMIIQMVFQNKHDIDVLVDESGAKTGQKIVMRPGNVTHGKDDSFFDKLMNIAEAATVVREWKGDIDAKQLAMKTNMEAQIAALSNKFDFDKADPKLPIVDRPKQNPKTKDDENWKRYVNTIENPGTLRQSVGLPIPEIKEIKLGSTREIPKPTTDPDGVTT